MESDSLTAIRWIYDGGGSSHPSATLVRAISSYPIQDGEVQLHHILREANQVADGLANHGLDITRNLVIFEFPPPFISFSLNADAASIAFPRGS